MIIRVFDSETGGLTPSEGDLIEIGWSDISLPVRIISDPKSYLCGTSKPITPENRAIHHINPATLIWKDAFDPQAFHDAAIADGVTCLAAFNAQFDLQWVKTTLPVICVYRCALRAWPHLTKHSNSAVFYALEADGRCQGANYAHIISHRAGPDAYVTAWILRALLEEGRTGKELLAWSKEPPLLPRCPIGKHKGKDWADVDSGWLRWAIGSDMDEDIKFNCRRALDNR